MPEITRSRRQTYAGGEGQHPTLRHRAYASVPGSTLRHRAYKDTAKTSVISAGATPPRHHATGTEKTPLPDLDKKLLAAVNMLQEMRRERDSIVRALDEFKLVRGNKAELAVRINEVLHMMGKDPEDLINPDDFSKSELQKRFRELVLEGVEDDDANEED